MLVQFPTAAAGCILAIEIVATREAGQVGLRRLQALSSARAGGLGFMLVQFQLPQIVAVWAQARPGLQ